MKEITRRYFLKALGAISVVFTIGFPNFSCSPKRLEVVRENFFESSIGKEKLELIKARQSGLYKDDIVVRKEFKLAVSDENPAIKQFYLKFAHHPLSEISETLLHTHYQQKV